MGNWNEEQEKQRETREKKKSYREKIGGYFLDLSKLSFAGLVIGGLISINLANISVKDIFTVTFGLCVTVFLGRIGNNFIK